MSFSSAGHTLADMSLPWAAFLPIVTSLDRASSTQSCHGTAGVAHSSMRVAVQAKGHLASAGGLICSAHGDGGGEQKGEPSSRRARRGLTRGGSHVFSQIDVFANTSVSHESPAKFGSLVRVRGEARRGTGGMRVSCRPQLAATSLGSHALVCEDTRRSWSRIEECAAL